MRKQAVLLPLLAAFLLLFGCGGEPKEYDVLSVFSADASRRSDFLTQVGDSTLWDELHLNGVTVTQGECREIKVGQEQWLSVSAKVSGDDAVLYFLQDSKGKWQLDVRTSFGVNSIPMEEWEEQEGILTVMVTASLSQEELPEPYLPYEAAHYTVEVADYTGENAITAVCTRESSDGDTLHSLLSDGQKHRVLLRLRAMTMEDGDTVWRITQFVQGDWLDSEARLRSQNIALLQAVRQGDTAKVGELLTADNIRVTDSNGDGLLFLAFQDNEMDTANLLMSKGCGSGNDNIYWHDMKYLCDFERSDIQALVNRIKQNGGAPGCTAESISHYLVLESKNTALAAFLAYYEPQNELSELESAELCARYGLETKGVTANLLDIAVLNNSAPVAQALLNDGVQATELLKQKIYLTPTYFSDQMLAVLGKQNYFGVLSEVLEDFKTFRQSYDDKAASVVERFHNSYNRFMDATVANEDFATKAIMDSSLLEDIEKQLGAVQKVTQPRTEAINALWNLMYQYADTMDTAGYYYKRTARSTYVVTRRYLYSMFETRLEQGEEYRTEFFRELAIYDKLLQNTK